jgi:hypothetical protein
MRTGTALSLIFHLAIVLLLLFGLPDLFASDEMVIEPVAVQLATVADLTTAPKSVETPPKPVMKPADTPPPPAPQAPSPPPTPTPPAPKQAEETPPPPPEPTPTPPPEPAPPQPQPAQTLPDLPAPEVIPDKTAPDQPPPEEAKADVPPPPPVLRPPQPDQPKPKPAKKPAQTADFNSLLKNLTNQQQTASATDTPPAPPQPDSSSSAAIGQQLTSSELDAVRSQIAGCWYLDPGKKGADTIIVQIAVTLLPDGTVQSADIVDQSKMGDPVFRAAAEAAQRAILKCQKLDLPPGKYDLWKNTTFRFNPSGFFG